MSTIDPIHPELEKLSKQNPFKVPDLYFDNFALKMADKINEAKETKVRNPIFGLIRPQVAAVLAFASIAFLVTLGLVFLRPAQQPMSSNELAEAMEYSIVSEMDESEIVNQLEKIDRHNNLSNDSIAKIKEVNSKQLMDYLSKENLDDNALIDAL